jgi:ketosteroid isomerase-like protein
MTMPDPVFGTIAGVIETRMRSFEAAERALDADRLIAHFAGPTSGYMYNDGQKLTFEAMALEIRGSFRRLRAIDGGFEDVDVVVLATDAALATARFQSTVTSVSGSETKQHGAATWLWRLLAGEWKITYGQIDHYPETSA